MFKNYALTAFRALRKQRLLTGINVGGLAIGLACACFIFLFIRHEASYDTFHADADRVYRVNYREIDRPAQRHMATISPPMAPAIHAAFPEVEDFARLRSVDGRHVFEHGDQRLYETDFFYADSSFFRLFSYPLVKGNPATALAAPNTVVLTEATARKYFGDADPMGQTLRMDGETNLTVTGVLAPLPSNTHLDFPLVLSFSTFRVPFGYPVTLESWGWISFPSYVKLAPGADPAALEAKLPAFLEANMGEETAREVRLELQPIADIYLGTPHHVASASGNPTYLYGLGAIAVLLLLLAGFDFANLTTAQALRRSREAGVRKALGAHRKQVIGQFLGEALLTVFLALLLALALVQVLSGAASALLERPLALRGSDLWVVVPTFAAVAALIGVLAGSYPALWLSRLHPALVLKGRGSGPAGGRFRQMLVVGQFAIAIALVAGSLIVAKQMDFMRQKDLGFETEQVVALNVQGAALSARYDALRARLLQDARVVNVSRSGTLLDGDHGSQPVFPENGENIEPHAIQMTAVDYDFFDTMGIDVVDGRGLSRSFPADSASGIVLNETAARLLATTVPGWDEPVGKALTIGALVPEGRVIGVVEDFHIASLHAPIAPFALFYPRTHVEYVLVRFAPGDVAAAQDALAAAWADVFPDLPLDAAFLDDTLDRLYQNDRQFARLTVWFTLITIFVACLGLYGLIAHATQVRTKEIGVRKVLGASPTGIVGLLSRQFLGHVLIANLVAWPLAYVAAQRWLAGFAFQASIGVGPFLAAGVLTLAIAWLTMSHQAFRAATSDPVQALRYE